MDRILGFPRSRARWVLLVTIACCVVFPLAAPVSGLITAVWAHWEGEKRVRNIAIALTAISIVVMAAVVAFFLIPFGPLG